MLAKFSELSNSGANLAQVLFDFDLLGAGVRLEALDTQLFRFNVAAQVGVLLFERADLAPLFT
jgi:hypothetical protein